MISNSSNFHVMAKPTGARCNLNCAYCFFLKKDMLYPGSDFRMSDEVMESYVRQMLNSQDTAHVMLAWQGGEPTMMGLDFFRRVVGAARKHARHGVCIEHTIQTNGVLIDEEWCEFLRENKFLVGLSMDGPRELHDAYRRDKAGKSVFDKVVRAARLMQEHRVEFNILSTVNAVNSLRPLDVYRFLRDDINARFVQFIPIVERAEETGDAVTDRSVRPEQYGRFLNAIFDEWVSRDVGTMFIQSFDSVLASYVEGRSSLCVLQPTCGRGVALEHNGDLYSCDHFVEPEYLLGNILSTPLAELVNSDKQLQFGRNKSDLLPQYCRECKFLFTCYGECPRNRLLKTSEGENGLNYLCVGLKAFFEHVDRPMRIMADLLRSRRPAKDVTGILSAERARLIAAATRVGRNEPCPCGSGRKAKNCHGADKMLEKN